MPSMFRATNNDYHGSGYSRGHLAPAAAHKDTQLAMNDTFNLNCNIVPQDQQCNASDWRRLEDLASHLATKSKNVYVFSGPMFLPKGVAENVRRKGLFRRGNTEKTGRGKQEMKIDGKHKATIKYTIVGPHHVSVPTHLFKIILVELDKSVAPSLSLGVPTGPILPSSPKEANVCTDGAGVQSWEPTFALAAFVVPNTARSKRERSAGMEQYLVRPE